MGKEMDWLISHSINQLIIQKYSIAFVMSAIKDRYMVLAQEYNQGGRSKKRLQEKLLLSCGLKNE